MWFDSIRHHAEFLTNLLKEALSRVEISVIYGTMDQTARKISIAKFRNGTSRILMVTDVAARGIGSFFLN